MRTIESNSDRITVVYDLTRTFIGAIFATPRGIDRIDFLLANHFSQHTKFNFVGLLPTPWGIRVFEANRVVRGLHRLEELWAEKRARLDDPQYVAVCNELRGKRGVTMDVNKSKVDVLHKGQRMASLLSASGFSFGRSARLNVPKNSVYVNVGHYSLAIPPFLSWLQKRRDVKPIIMLHDTIPLDQAELVSPLNVRHHKNIVRSAARYAEGLIVTTAHARETVLASLAAEGRSEIKTLCVGLPLAEAFDSAPEPDPILENIPYFVVCGTVEPRKNHLLLLNVWRRLCASPGTAPHLIVIGSRGWHGGSILDQILRCETTRGRIHHVEGLSTQAMKALIAGSRGLLSPSFAEGFGLPIIEAIHLGVPIVASDIPAHREVAGQNAILLDPCDGPAWREAIRVLNMERNRMCSARSSIESSRKRQAYLSLIDDFIRTV